MTACHAAADLATRVKELRTAGMDRQRAISAKNDAEMQADKLQAKMAAMPKVGWANKPAALLPCQIRQSESVLLGHVHLLQGRHGNVESAGRFECCLWRWSAVSLHLQF